MKLSGSRLIDMTAKKNDRCFFGKFSELISVQPDIEESKKTRNINTEVSREKK